jgi:hypothetical protein
LTEQICPEILCTGTTVGGQYCISPASISKEMSICYNNNKPFGIFYKYTTILTKANTDLRCSCGVYFLTHKKSAAMYAFCDELLDKRLEHTETKKRKENISNTFFFNSIIAPWRRWRAASSNVCCSDHSYVIHLHIFFTVFIHSRHVRRLFWLATQDLLSDI